jgi:hypothetical protein
VLCVGKLFLLWQVEIILRRRDRNTGTVSAQRTVRIITCQNARCARRNEARFT